MKKTIGVLGGIGPESSAEFYRRIIEKLQEKKYIKSNTDYPHIIINSIPASELLLKNPDLSMYKQGVKDLENAGADFIVIVCNTAYIFLKELQEEVSIPIIDLKSEVEKEIQNLKVKSLAIFGSNRVVKQLFQFGKTKTIELEDKELEILDKIIINYNAGIDKSKYERDLQGLIDKYSKKADFILIACTELSSMTKNMKFNKMDTMDVMVNSTTSRWLGS